MYLRNISKYIPAMAVTLGLGLGLGSCSDEMNLAEGGEGNMVLKARLKQNSGLSQDFTRAAGSKVAVRAAGKTYTYTLGADGSMTADGAGLNWGGENFNITAWTPETEKAVALADQSTPEKIAACDLLAARGQATSRYVYLMFTHQMTRMSWDFRSIDASYTAQQMKEAQVQFLGYGSVTFAEGAVKAAGNPDTRISTLESVTDGVRGGEAIMAPADMWGKPLVRILIGGDEYFYTPSRDNMADAASDAGTLLAGNWQKYHLTITRKTLSVEMETSDVAWGAAHEFTPGDITDAKLLAEIASDVSDKPGYTVRGLDHGYITDRTSGFTISYTENGLGGLSWTGNCTVTRTETPVAGSSTATTHTYTFSNVKTDITVSYLSGVDEGDYLYDNGAWGKEESREGCVTIGRVFHAGRDSRDDSSYSLCKVRGYVVPLAFGNTTELQWFADQASQQYLKSLADIPVSADPAVRESYYGGYKLTGLLNSALAPFSSDWADQVPFWNAYKHVDMSAPALSSGWYVPTYAQLKDVCASGMYDRFSGVYWSSQVYAGTGNSAVGGVEEGDKTTLWAIRCDANQAVGYGWAIDRAKLLTILTF